MTEVTKKTGLYNNNRKSSLWVTEGKAQKLTRQLKHNTVACIQIHKPRTFLLSCCSIMEQLELNLKASWVETSCLPHGTSKGVAPSSALTHGLAHSA